MQQAIAGNKDTISNLNVAPEQRAVGKNNVVTNADVVADMGVDHEEIIRADDRRLFRDCGAMHRGPLAEKIAAANDQAGGFMLLFDILRSVADDGPDMETIVGADGRVAGQVNVRAHAATRANGDMGVDDGIGADFNGGVQLGLGADDGRGMDHVR